MAAPARKSTDGPGPDDDPERKPDPRASAWSDVRRMLIAEARACRLAVEEMAARPGDGRSRALAASVLSALESASIIAGRCKVSEALLEAERARAYAQGVADCRAARCRMEVLDGGRAGPR